MAFDSSYNVFDRESGDMLWHNFLVDGSWGVLPASPDIEATLPSVEISRPSELNDAARYHSESLQSDPRIIQALQVLFNPTIELTLQTMEDEIGAEHFSSLS